MSSWLWVSNSGWVQLGCGCRVSLRFLAGEMSRYMIVYGLNEKEIRIVRDLLDGGFAFCLAGDWASGGLLMGWEGVNEMMWDCIGICYE